MLEASFCKNCKTILLPPGRNCSRCNQKTETIMIGNTAKILSYTTLMTAPEGFKAPLNLILVGLPFTAKLLCNADNMKRMAIGDSVYIKKVDDRYFAYPVGGMDNFRDKLNNIPSYLKVYMLKGKDALVRSLKPVVKNK